MTDYNGWTNYETWCVKLWIDNCQSSQESWLGTARRSATDAPVNPFCNSRKTERRIWLAKQLKAEHETAAEEWAPEQSSVFSDLLTASLGAVNWHEIADALLSDADELSPPDDDETEGE